MRLILLPLLFACARPEPVRECQPVADWTLLDYDHQFSYCDDRSLYWALTDSRLSDMMMVIVSGDQQEEWFCGGPLDLEVELPSDELAVWVGERDVTCHCTAECRVDDSQHHIEHEWTAIAGTVGITWQPGDRDFTITFTDLVLEGPACVELPNQFQAVEVWEYPASCPDDL